MLEVKWIRLVILNFNDNTSVDRAASGQQRPFVNLTGVYGMVMFFHVGSFHMQIW